MVKRGKATLYDSALSFFRNNDARVIGCADKAPGDGSEIWNPFYLRGGIVLIKQMLS